MALTAGSHVILTIEKPVAGGRMLARHEGQVVFVAGAIPGERVRARVERVAKHLAFAVSVDVLDASPDRRGVDIDWACGGSLYAHIAYERQVLLKAELVADAFERIGKLELDAPVRVRASKEEGYRMRARLHAADGATGFFREGTHQLCPAAPTRQLLAETTAAVDRVCAVVLPQGLTGLRACDVSENIAATERAILLELDAIDRAPVNVEPVEGVTGLLFAETQSSRLTVAYGSPYVTDRLAFESGTASLTHHVQSFFQGNRYLLADLAARVVEQVPEGPIVDLYAGVGLFAVSLAVHGRRNITAVEGDRASARDLEANAAHHSPAIRVVHGSVEAYLERARPDAARTLIVDPPRTGISRQAMSGLVALKAARIVYVSCDAPTLARDMKRFKEVGYELSHIEAFDLFPNTPHVETLAVLTRWTTSPTS